MAIDIGATYADGNLHTENDTFRGWSDFGNMLFSNQIIDYIDAVKSVLLGVISNRIINEVRGVNRVVYDISSKPPAAIK